ncbi:MAG TPA: glycosyltransferase [Candidatus Acidoferrales bacterium]|jgi:glycosyltransferase involved in cell wall biosynthesis|nr:glycosyltransferase [Candidatus Acidoferrales bacterium]
MRILNVTQSYAPFFEFGGPPEKVRALSEGLAQLGHEVTVLTADWGLERRLSELPGEPPAENSPFGKKREVRGVKAIYLANWFHYHAASWNPALTRYLRARLQNFDVIHIFGLYDLLGPRTAAAAQKLSIPYVVEPIGMFVPIVRNLFLKRAYHRFLGRNMLHNAAAIIATAEQEKSELIAGGIPADKIVLRRNGVAPPASLPARGAFRTSLNIPPDARLILFLGRLSQKKSPDLLLQAFAQLPPSSTAAHLAFVGPDESGMRARLQQMAANSGVARRVHFVGPLSGAPKWSAYRDADIFVLPSQNENFGNTAAESVAAGTPVIVTDQCGIAPLLDGVAGMVVQHSVSSIAGTLSTLLHEPALYTQLKNGCATAVQRLDWSSPTREMDSLYRKLTGLATSSESQAFGSRP